MYQGKENVRLRVFNLGVGTDLEDLNRLLEDPEMNVLGLEVRTRDEANGRTLFGRRATEMVAVVLFERVVRKPSRRQAGGSGRGNANGGAADARPASERKSRGTRRSSRKGPRKKKG